MKDANIPTPFQKMRSHRPRILEALAKIAKYKEEVDYYEDSRFYNLILQHLESRRYFQVVGYTDGKFNLVPLNQDFSVFKGAGIQRASLHFITTEYRPIKNGTPYV